MDPKVSEALDVLQRNAPRNSNRGAVWLDKHQEQLMVVLNAKGPNLTAELLAIKKSSLYSYLRRRQLIGLHSTRHERREPAEAPEPQTSQLTPADEACYWRGHSDALRFVLEALMNRDRPRP